MSHLSMLGDKTTILCTFLVPWLQIVRLGLGLGFLVLLFRVRVRVRVSVRVSVRVIITLICIRLLREGSFLHLFLLCNLTVRDECNMYL